MNGTIKTPRGVKKINVEETQEGRIRFVFLCTNCGITYANSVKTDVEWHKRMHTECRTQHVAAMGNL